MKLLFPNKAQGSIQAQHYRFILPLLVGISACSGSDSTDNAMGSAGVTNTADVIAVDIETGDTVTTGMTASAVTTMGETMPVETDPIETDPTEHDPDDQAPESKNLISSSVLPALSTDNTVTWPFDAIPSGLEVQVEPYVELPLASNGSPARWNSMSSFDERTFIVDEQDGLVYEITNRTANLWFDIANAVQSNTGRSLDTSNTFHGGVRGIAFHPEFKNNGKFYTSIMEQRPANPSNHLYISDQSGIGADSVLVEWTADTNTLLIDPGSYREVFRVGVPEFDHPIKQIAFNPFLSSTDGDYGNLYIAHGDGSVESSLAGTGQSNDALGKILRINPLQNGDNKYSVPRDNPFLSDDSLPDEVFSYGHRNPHHLAFTASGHLLTTEAGRDNIDEINVVVRGANYGWPEREGAFTQLDTGGLAHGIAALPENDELNGFVYPAAQFGHHGNAGASFTGEALGGGYVIENDSALSGEFFYIDFPKSGLLMHSSLSELLQARTVGVPSKLNQAQPFSSTIKFDHDNNPDTPALDNDLKQIVQSAAGYENVFNRVDIRILQGPQGEMYLSSKRNSWVYLVSNSLP